MIESYKNRKVNMINKIAAMTIAGSDSGGGAGIQADLKTFSSLGVYGTTVITSITAQNIKEITDIFVLDSEIVEKQILTTINYYPIKAIKTGLLYSEDIIESIAKTIEIPLKEKGIKLIIDPIMVSTSGKALLTKRATRTIQDILFPIASLITPNIPEAELITGKKIETIEDMKTASKIMFDMFKVPILLKGGHLSDMANDVLLIDKKFHIYETDIIKDIDTHGSGCTLSAAITAYLSLGNSLAESVKLSKEFITASLNNPFKLNDNLKIINHFF